MFTQANLIKAGGNQPSNGSEKKVKNQNIYKT